MSSLESIQHYRQRRTISDEIKIEGIGIHTGSETSVRLEPAESGDGIHFIRVDCDPEVRFRPSVDRVQDDSRSTVLRSEGEDLYTVEHLLAALFGLGVTDLNVYIDGPEIPALNGSAGGFVEAIEDVGLEELDGDRSIYRVQEPVFSQNGDGSIAILPCQNLKISCTISYDNEYIGDQFLSITITPEQFAEEIAPARTFGFKEEVEDLLEQDLARGGSLDNALILDEEGNLVGDEPQFPDEFVRHKILDILGDLSLAGTFFTGHVVAVKNGHSLNLSLARKLADKVDRNPEIVARRREMFDREGMSIEQIKQVLPHRYPFLLVDRILMVDIEEQLAQGLKNVTVNEEFFQGHFPDDPVMPGVLIIEALAQLGASVILNMPENQGKNSYFMGVDNVKWRRPVRPGDQLFLEVEGTRLRPGARMGKMKGEAYVDGTLAAEGDFKFALVD